MATATSLCGVPLSLVPTFRRPRSAFRKALKCPQRTAAVPPVGGRGRWHRHRLGLQGHKFGPCRWLWPLAQARFGPLGPKFGPSGLECIVPRPQSYDLHRINGPCSEPKVGSDIALSLMRSIGNGAAPLGGPIPSLNARVLYCVRALGHSPGRTVPLAAVPAAVSIVRAGT